MPARGSIAAVYRTHSRLLRADPSHTVGSVSTSLVAALSAIAEIDQYTEVRQRLNADLMPRWDAGSMGRVDLADYYDAIAAGLEGARDE